MFRARLDFIFTNVRPPHSAAFSKLNSRQGYFESTNEPSQQMPYMYHYINKPGLSTQRSRQILAEFYNTSRNGLPGNDGTNPQPSPSLWSRSHEQLRLWRHGVLCGILSAWNVPPTWYPPDPIVLAFLQRGSDLQPTLRLDDSDRRKWFHWKSKVRTRWQGLCQGMLQL